MLRLSGITKKFPDGICKGGACPAPTFNHVLRGVSMNVEKGDFVAIKGASGSGKTTLLSILGTLLQPDSGSYVLDNQEINTPGVDYSAVRNQKLGFVFQDHRLMPQLTALENILLPTLAFQNKTTDSQIDYAKQLMELTGITSVANQYPDTLSGGEASRAAVCRALIMKPLLVLADEPTGQLDAENARNIALLLKKINMVKTGHALSPQGTTIVMVTHSDEVSAVANRVLMLKDGILV